MCLAVTIQFQQVLLEATFILEVQIHLQQSIAQFKAFQSCSEAGHRSTSGPRSLLAAAALRSELGQRAGGLPTQVWQFSNQHGGQDPPEPPRLPAQV